MTGSLRMSWKGAVLLPRGASAEMRIGGVAGRNCLRLSLRKPWTSLNTKQRRYEAGGDVPHIGPLEDSEWRELRSAKRGCPFWKKLKSSESFTVLRIFTASWGERGQSYGQLFSFRKSLKQQWRPWCERWCPRQFYYSWTTCDHLNNTVAFFHDEMVFLKIKKINKKRIFHWLVKVWPVQHTWQIKQAIPTTGVISAASNRCPHFTSATAIKHHKSVWPSKRANSCALTIVCDRDCSRRKSSCLKKRCHI